MVDYNTKIIDRTTNRKNINTGFVYQFTLSTNADDFNEFRKQVDLWCMDNLDKNEYFMESSSLSSRIIIYTHTYEASMAVRLTWDNI